MTEEERFERNARVIEELFSRQTLYILLSDFGGKSITTLCETLMKNGCPAKAILRTLGELSGDRNEKD